MDAVPPNPSDWQFVVMGSLHLLTFLVCIIILFVQEAKSWRLYVFLVTTLHACIGAAHFVVRIFLPMNLPILLFAMYYVRLMQYMVITYYFTTLACTLFRRESMIARMVNPFFILLGFFMTAALIWSGLEISTFTPMCKAPYWMYLSGVFCLCIDRWATAFAPHAPRSPGTGILLNSVFLAMGILITRRIVSHQIISKSLRDERVTVLRVLISCNFVTTLVIFSYDLYVDLDSWITSDDRCDMIIPNNTPESIIAFIVVRIITQLIPDWAVIIALFILPAIRAYQKSHRPAENQLEREQEREEGGMGAHSTYSVEDETTAGFDGVDDARLLDSADAIDIDATENAYGQGLYGFEPTHISARGVQEASWPPHRSIMTLVSGNAAATPAAPAGRDGTRHVHR